MGYYFFLCYNVTMLRVTTPLHTALYTEGSRYRGQYRRQRLKNEFPSFLFHFENKLKGLNDKDVPLARRLESKLEVN